MTLRVAAHVHSTWSYDGQRSLADIAGIFGARGCDAVLVTEHDRGFTDDRFAAYVSECAALSAEPGSPLLVPGIEYSDADNVVHLLTWGADRFLGQDRPSLDTARDVTAAGGAIVFAHPSRKDAWRRLDDELAGSLSAIERWNRKTDGFLPSADAERVLQLYGLPAFVGMDFHHKRHLFPLIMRIDAERDAESIVAAIKRGAFASEAFGRPVDDLLRSPRGRVLAVAERLRRVRHKVKGVG